jgi:serine/threonine protein kinase
MANSNSEHDRDNEREVIPEGDISEVHSEEVSVDKMNPEHLLEKYPELARELKNLFHWIASHHSGKKGLEDDPLDDWLNGSVGRNIGDFKIIRELGSGGMARVFEAEQKSLKRVVALKVLAPHFSLSDKALLKFQREAVAGGRQKHPGIVSVYATGEHDGVHYIVQELVEGGRTLADEFLDYSKSGNLHRGHYNRMAGIIAGVAEALAHAHSSGVIHRDVKPSNILITLEGRPKITDFGLARVDNFLSLSQSGDLSGTPYYMSPEQVQLRRGTIDHRTDIFSLGVTLYKALTLKRPFEGTSSHEVTKKIMSHVPVEPRNVNHRVSRDLSIICMKAIEKDPNRRYQTMTEFSEDLRSYLAGEPISARPMGRIRKSFHWIRRNKIYSLTAAASLLVMAMIAMIALDIYKKNQEEHRIIENRYKLGRETLGWPNFFRRDDPGYLYTRSDPSDPGGYMLQAIFDIESGQLETAVQKLDECIAKCKLNKSVFLEKDAHYLLAVARHRLADGMEDDLKKASLRKEADFHLNQIGKYDPLSLNALVWHEEEDRDLTETGMEKWFLRPIKLNSEHFLVHMYQGLLQFDVLYKGGERRDFEDAIKHLECALKLQPENMTALTILGRIKYFFARFYNLIWLLDDVIMQLDKAIEVSGDSPFHLSAITLGQVWLLRGNNEKALKYYLRSLGDARGSITYIHNVYRGIGTIYAREGRFVEAQEQFEKALKIVPEDSNTNLALSNFLLHQGHNAEALEYAKKAMERFSLDTQTKYPTRLASPFLMCARIYLAQNKYSEALKCLCAMSDSSNAIHSPRDLSFGCFLIATFPEEEFSKTHEDLHPIRVANNLANHAGFDAKDSPVCLSALGTAAYLNGKYRQAHDYFKMALKEMERWPEETRKYYWPADAHIFFELAMVHAKLSMESLDGKADHAEARKYYEKAETIYQTSSKFTTYEYADIIDRIRDSARGMFSESLKTSY